MEGGGLYREDIFDAVQGKLLEAFDIGLGIIVLSVYYIIEQ